MRRTALLLLTIVPVGACEGRQKTLDAAGPKSAYAAEQGDSSAATTRRIAEKGDYWFGLSRDGTLAAVTDWNTGDILIRDIRTGTSRTIIHNVEPYKDGFGMAPLISPDGKAIVVEWWDNTDGAQLRLVRLDGSPARVLFDDRNHIKPEDWSSDGRTIVAIHARDDGTKQIVLVPADSGPVRVLKTLDWREPMRMNFSPDGRYVVYDYPTVDGSNAHRDLFVLDLSNGSESRLVEHKANDYVLGWGPDATHVLFASDRTGTVGAWLQEVQNGRAKGAPVLVKPDLWAPTPGQFAADGSYYYGVQTANRGIYLAAADSLKGTIVGEPTLLTPISSDRASDPQWSPDGRTVSYLLTNQVATQSRIALRSRESGEVREVPIPNGVRYVFHRWAPDGKSLILSASEKGRDGAFRIDPRTGRMETLYLLDRGTGTGSWLNVLPSGREVVYAKAAKEKSPEIVVRDLATQSERVLYRSKAIIAPRIALSPDGDRVAFMERTAAGSIPMVVPVRGGEARQVGNDPPMPAGHIAWSADGRALLVGRAPRDPKSVGKAELWRVPLDGSAASPTGLLGDNLGIVRPDRTGRHILFDAGRDSIEFWVMSDILPGARATRATAR
jgi:Tol biopolymer transport system component